MDRGKMLSEAQARAGANRRRPGHDPDRSGDRDAGTQPPRSRITPRFFSARRWMEDGQSDERDDDQFARCGRDGATDAGRERATENALCRPAVTPPSHAEPVVDPEAQTDTGRRHDKIVRASQLRSDEPADRNCRMKNKSPPPMAEAGASADPRRGREREARPFGGANPSRSTAPEQPAVKRHASEERQIRSGEPGSDAVRTGHARAFRKKRADNRGRPGSRRANVSPQERAREVTQLDFCGARFRTTRARSGPLDSPG